MSNAKHKLEQQIQDIIKLYPKSTIEQRIIFLSQMKQLFIKTQCAFLKQLHAYIIQFFVCTLKTSSETQQRKLFLNVFAYFVKTRLSCQQFDKINERIINILEQSKDSLVICIEFLTQILEVMQQNPPCKYQRFLINHTLNNYLTLANILIDRCVYKKDNSDQSYYEVVASDECICSLVKLLNTICRYDFQSTMRGQQSDQYVWDRSPILIPTKYSRYSKFQQFQQWIRKDSIIDLYQYLYFACKSRELKIAIIDLLGDLSRVHFRFFKTKNNYKTYIGNIVYAYIQILSGLTLQTQSNYVIAVNLIKNIYKIFTSNMLFQIQFDLRQAFYQSIAKFINFQIFDKFLISQSMIQFLNFLIIAWDKGKYESSERYQNELEDILTQIQVRYEDILIGVVKGHMTSYPISNTFWDCIEQHNQENLKQFLLIFRKCKPKYRFKPPICLLMQFEYNLCLYLQCSEKDYQKQKAEKVLIDIFDGLSALPNSNKDKKLICGYILMQLQRCPIQLSGFFQKTQINLVQFLCYLLQTMQEKYLNLIFHIVKNTSQLIMKNISDLEKMKQTIKYVIEHSNYVGQNMLKIHQIYVYLVESNEIKEQSLPYILIQAIMHNYKADKYNLKFQNIYQVVKKIILKGNKIKQSLLNNQSKDIHLLKTVELFLILENNLPTMEKYVFVKTFASIIKEAAFSIFQKMKNYDTDCLLQNATVLINCCNMLLLYMYESKYILKEHADPNLSYIIQASSTILGSVVNNNALYYQPLSHNLVQLIKTTFYYYLPQVFQHCKKEIYEIWLHNKSQFSFIPQLLTKILFSLSDEMLIQFIKWIQQNIKQDINNIWKYTNLMKIIYDYKPSLIQQNIQEHNSLKFFVWVSTNSSEEVTEKLQQIKNNENSYQKSKYFENGQCKKVQLCSQISHDIDNQQTREQTQEKFEGWQNADTQFLCL